MKIALIGNVCNNMYNVGMALRRHAGNTVHLYLGDKLNIFTNPIFNVPADGDQSEWVFCERKWDPTLLYKRLDFRFVSKLRAEQYDVIIVSDVGVWLAPLVNNAKFFFWTTGADITRMPFPFRFNFFHRKITSKLKAWYMALIQRWGIRCVDFVMTQPFMPFQCAVKRLNIPPEKLLIAYFPIIIDLEMFKYNKRHREGISDGNHKKMERFVFKIYHPSRLMIDKSPALVESGQWKGNDTLLRGLRAFIDTYGVNDICIMLPERSDSYDRLLFESEIARLELQQNIIWLHGKTSEGFDKSEMVALYSSADLVVDEFGVGWFGSIVVEATACSKPTMCYLDEECMKKMYPYNPIISVNTPEAIATEIAKLYFDKPYAKRRGEESRKWAEEFHSPINAGKKYVEQISAALPKAVSHSRMLSVF